MCFPLSIFALHCRFSSSEMFPKEISLSALEKFPNCCCTGRCRSRTCELCPPQLSSHSVLWKKGLVNIGRIFLGRGEGLTKAKGEVRRGVSWLKLQQCILQVRMLDRHQSSCLLFLTIWFSRDFHGSVCLSCHPSSPATSWQQNLVYATLCVHTEPRVTFSKTYKIIIPRLSLWK